MKQDEDSLNGSTVSRTISETLAKPKCSLIETVRVKQHDETEWEVKVIKDTEGLRQKPFLMRIETSFILPGRGKVVAGRIQQGYVIIEDKIMAKDRSYNPAIVLAIGVCRQITTYAEFGDVAELLFSEDCPFEEGDILYKCEL